MGLRAAKHFKKSPMLERKFFHSKLQFFVLFMGMTMLFGCVKSGYNESVVYNNNFKSGSSEKLTGAILYKNNGDTYLGRYNNGGFTLNLDNLPAHKAIQIIVEPHMHDTWDGNNNFGGIDGPDIWEVTLDGNRIIHSTFSNSPCNALYCLYQSYPADYVGIINNPPRTGAFGDMPSICSGGNDFRTSVYKIEKTIQHTGSKATISLRDYLVQTNVPDPKCDESWSLGGLVVKVINTP